MVKVRELHKLQKTSDVDLDAWIERLAVGYELQDGDVQVLRNACQCSLEAEKKKAGDDEDELAETSSFFAGLEMAEILAGLHLDIEGLQAAILYRTVREGKLDLNYVKKEFGENVSSLIERVLQMAVISTLRNDSGTDVFGSSTGHQAAKVREMLVSIIDDVRVGLIKIADRTCALRAVKRAPKEERLRVAREVFDVYAPLAHRLGIGHLKWELEDLAYRYLEEDEYMHIARLLDEKRLDRQNYIEKIIETLRDELKKADIKGEVTGRVKHIYSIIKKMQRKDIGFSQVYDIRAVRILVSTVADCYAALGIIHSLWRNIPNEFDDYIAAPKENGYRSLHTAVIGPQGRIVEVQIRTFEMHEEAELGVCAHWRYKGSDARTSTQSYEEKISWLRQVLEWHEEIEGDGSAALLHQEGSPDRIYVFTPEGHVVDLPEESTPLDFAYRVHTSIGHRCRGAKVNGRIVPLNSKLKTADQVEILTGKQEMPSRDWMSTSMGYLHSARSRSKVQQWFRKQDRDKNLTAGRMLVEKILRQLGLRDIDLGTIAEKFNKKGEEGLFIAVGAGDLSVDQIVGAVQAKLTGGRKSPSLPVRSVSKDKLSGKSDVYIYGVGDLMTRIAKCCHPLPGDEIIGYITFGRGVTIHRIDCGNILRHQADEPERIIQVNWGGKPQSLYPVEVVIDAYDRSGLLRDITTTIDRAGINIQSIQSQPVQPERAINFSVHLVLEVSGIDQLSRLLSQLLQVANVVAAKRINN